MARTKIKIMNTKPDITDEEIRNSMDFDRVLSMAQQALRNDLLRNRRIRFGLFAAGALFIGAATYIALTRETPAPATVAKPAPIVTEPEPGSPASGNAPKKVAEPDRPKTSNAKKKEVAHTLDVQYDSATSQFSPAEPLEGYPALYEYFDRELKYPNEALKDSIQGVLTVTFMIDKQGKPFAIKTADSPAPAFDREAIRLIEQMPPWKPARLDGKAVSSKLSIPLTFKIKKVR